MAAARESVLYDVHDAKVYPLTSDTGASPTYGTGIDVYGISDASFEPNLVSAELKGDGRVIAKKALVDRFNFDLTYGRLSVDVLAAVLGGSVSDPSASEARYRYAAGATPPYFGIGLRVSDLDNGNLDLHVIAYKCKVTGGTLLGQSSDNFGQPSIQAEGIGLDCPSGPWNGVTVDVAYYSVATPLPATLAT